MNNYPKDITYAEFNPPLPPPPRPPRTVLQIPKSTSSNTVRSDVRAFVCGVKEIYLRSRTTNTRSDNSHKSTQPNHPTIAHNDPARFCFAPLKEEVWIRWRHKNPALIGESRLDLFCLMGGAYRKIWSKTFTWKPGECPEDGKALFNGSLTEHNESLERSNNKGLQAVTRTYDAGAFGASFPGKCVTAEFSPYKLQVTVVPISPATHLAPSHAWMYFDIVVADIEMEWCPDADLDKILPNTNKAKNLVVSRALADGADATNLNGAVPPPGQTKKVFLKSHTFYQSAAELADITYYNRYQNLWGDGPAFPVFAKAKIRDSAGNPVDAPLATGRLKFMWDWVDKGGDPFTVIADANIQAWIDESRNYKAAQTNDSPAGQNCHVDRGGKRGPGAVTCFPAQAGKAAATVLPPHNGSDQMFPFQVEPLNGGGSPFTARRWAAYSYTWASGVLAGKTGVLFQPSRMAGDGFDLHVYLAYDSHTEMQNNAAPGTMPAGLHKGTGTFRIWREFDIIRHWRMRTTSPEGTLLDLASVKSRFERYFIRLNLPGAVDRNIGNWFVARQRVLTAAPPPAPPLDDFIRAASEAAPRDHLVHLVDHDVWYNRVKAAHGVTDAAVQNWANGVTNGLDLMGNPRLHAWEQLYGNNGLQPIIKPWPLNFLANVGGLAEGAIRISFPTLLPGVADLDLVFDSGGLGRHKTSLTATQITQIKTKMDAALLAHRNLCGGSNFVSYGRGPTAALHIPLDVRLSGALGNNRQTERIDNVRDALIAQNNVLSMEAALGNYENNNARLGWGFMIFDATMENIMGAQEGIVALQATDLSNKDLPKGKAFYANAAGNRAIAATLADNPSQMTFEHEIGHAVYLNHTYQSQPTSDPNYLHQKNDPSGGPCIMFVTPSTGCTPTSLFCGFCIIRLWGWSFAKTDAAGAMAVPASRTLWYDSAYNKNPGAPAAIPPHPTGGRKQVESILVAGTVTTAGNASLTVTAAGMAHSPKTVHFSVANGDIDRAIADKARIALSGDPDVIAFFKVDVQSFTTIKLEALVKAANDATMNVAINNGTCVGLVPVAVSAHTTAGVAAPLHP